MSELIADLIGLSPRDVRAPGEAGARTHRPQNPPTIAPLPPTLDDESESNAVALVRAAVARAARVEQRHQEATLREAAQLRARHAAD